MKLGRSVVCAFCRTAIGSYALGDGRLVCTGYVRRALLFAGALNP